MQKIRTSAFLVSSLLFFSLIWSSPSSIATAMADDASTKPQPSATPEAAAVHIVYTERPADEDPEAFHIRILTSVVGSEEAAKEALVYSYKHAASGFSAKLTPDQVSQMSRQPGVLQVVPSRTVQLHSGPARLNV
ncbi:subtilisin-like protease SBT3.17 [Diospyros lotus]|uniref:subtilisin-like protease SBT3.17 n=1 Tax=Diospyros lotus TaxID=55363 RepID=UPI00224F87C7|nr:subtilisin-like protease SBT3.17 [Diospyros lotus]